MRFLTQVPLRTIFVVPFVLLSTLTVGLVGYLSFQNSQQAVTQLVSQLNGEANARVIEHLENFLEKPIKLIEANRDTIAMDVVDLNDIDRADLFFGQQLQWYPLTGLFYISKAGNRVSLSQLLNEQGDRDGSIPLWHIQTASPSSPSPFSQRAPAIPELLLILLSFDRLARCLLI
ncbi:MAG: hypothetical protein AAGG51_13070 [Cyanobacteria bacterium P01_G01_bin.54]